MGRSRVRRVLSLVTLSVLVGGCGSSLGEPSAAVSASGPATVWFAVLSSAADPNALDADRAAIVDALGESFAAHVVVSQGACFTGLPARYGSGYVLAVWDDDEDAVHGDLDDAGSQAEWIGQVTSTCVD